MIFLISDDYTSLTEKDIFCRLFRINWMDGSFLLKTLRYCVSGIQPRFTMRLLVDDKRLPRSSLRGGPMWVFLSFIFFIFWYFWANGGISSFIFFWFLIRWSFLSQCGYFHYSSCSSFGLSWDNIWAIVLLMKNLMLLVMNNVRREIGCQDIHG